jgi:ABC-type multidrug transport system fused ATPase/permease subunit
MDALLTLVAVLFNYAGPFFLKQILEAIDNPSREARARAYIYALLTFLASLIKVRAFSHAPPSGTSAHITWQTQADMHHLWYGRQAVTRTRSLLMAAVYDKALKRKDFSGAVAASTSAKAAGGGSIKKAVLEQVGKGKNKSP